MPEVRSRCAPHHDQGDCRVRRPAIVVFMLTIVVIASFARPPAAATRGLWTPVQSLAIPRFAHSATLLPLGEVLVAGGYNTTINYKLNSVVRFNPTIDRWSA